MTTEAFLANLVALATAAEGLLRVARSDDAPPASEITATCIEQVEAAVFGLTDAIHEVVIDDDAQVLEPGTIGDQDFQVIR